MRFGSPLVRARLIARRNRFVAEVALEDGTPALAHCPNPGAMLGLAEPGAAIWLEPVAGAQRRLPYAWRLVDLPGGQLAGIDTTVPNRVVAEALRARAVPALAAWGQVRAEVRLGPASRVDFLLSEPGLPDCFVEVKNVHLRRDGDWAEFPDCVTARGARHLQDLARVVAGGGRAAMLYLVQRPDCARFRLAADLDPAYARAFDAARAAGVRMLAHGAQLSCAGVTLGPELPVDPAAQARALPRAAPRPRTGVPCRAALSRARRAGN